MTSAPITRGERPHRLALEFRLRPLTPAELVCLFGLELCVLVAAFAHLPFRGGLL